MPTDNIYLSQGRKYTIKRKASTDLPARMVSPPLCLAHAFLESRIFLTAISRRLPSPPMVRNLGRASKESVATTPGTQQIYVSIRTSPTQSVTLPEQLPLAESTIGLQIPAPSLLMESPEARKPLWPAQRLGDGGTAQPSQTITRAKQHVEAFSKCRVA